MDTLITISYHNRIPFFKGADGKLLSVEQLNNLTKLLRRSKKRAGEIGSQEAVLAQEYLADAIQIVSNSKVNIPRRYDNIHASGFCFFVVKAWSREHENLVRLGFTSSLRAMRTQIANKVKAETQVLLYIQSQEHRRLSNLIQYVLRNCRHHSTWYYAEPAYQLFNHLLIKAGQANKLPIER